MERNIVRWVMCHPFCDESGGEFGALLAKREWLNEATKTIGSSGSEKMPGVMVWAWKKGRTLLL
jgi:hypothetical protein